MKIEVSAPGKTILHGEHAVVYGKAAVAVSVSLKTNLILIPQKTKITLNFKNLDLTRVWDLMDFKEPFCFPYLDLDIPPVNEEITKLLVDTFSLNVPEDQPESHKSSMLAFFYLFIYTQQKYRNFHRPCSIDIESQLSIGSGMGSSASFSVCLSTAMLMHCNRVTPPLTDEDRDLINKWSYNVERIFHGKPSGIDNLICTLGGALLYENGKMSDYAERIPNIKILLVNTKVPRNTKVLVEHVKKKHEIFPHLIETIMEAIDTISKESWKIINSSQDSFYENGYLQTLQSLVTMNHHLLNALDVGHAKLDMVHDIAQTYSCTSKLTGAGGGGCAIVLVTPTEGQQEDSIVTLIEKLRGCGFDVQNIVLGCPGVQARIVEN